MLTGPTATLAMLEQFVGWELRDDDDPAGRWDPVRGVEADTRYGQPMGYLVMRGVAGEWRFGGQLEALHVQPHPQLKGRAVVTIPGLLRAELRARWM